MEPDEPEPLVERPSSTLALDMLALMEDAETADVEFRVGPPPGRPLYAHRVVLMHRSDYFRALLAGGFREDCARAKIRLMDMRPHVFQSLLEFVYTDNVKALGDDPGLAVELLRCSARYCMPRLLALCEVRLCGAATQQNVPRLLMLSQLCHAPQLEAFCRHFARRCGVDVLANSTQRAAIAEARDEVHSTGFCDVDVTGTAGDCFAPHHDNRRVAFRVVSTGPEMRRRENGGFDDTNDAVYDSLIDDNDGF
jgi:hypothetical protein